MKETKTVNGITARCLCSTLTQHVIIGNIATALEEDGRFGDTSRQDGRSRIDVVAKDILQNEEREEEEDEEEAGIGDQAQPNQTRQLSDSDGDDNFDNEDDKSFDPGKKNMFMRIKV